MKVSYEERQPPTSAPGGGATAVTTSAERRTGLKAGQCIELPCKSIQHGPLFPCADLVLTREGNIRLVSQRQVPSGHGGKSETLSMCGNPERARFATEIGGGGPINLKGNAHHLGRKLRFRGGQGTALRISLS